MKLYSATEVDAARGCLRKWAGKYASDWPKLDAGPGAGLGKEGHGIQEKYLRDGVAPPADGIGALCRAGLPFLPPPGSGVVEGPLGGPVPKGAPPKPLPIEGIPFHGYMDWHGPANVIPQSGWQGAAPDVLAVLDHKFNKDIRRHGLWSEEKCLDDVQSLVYRLAIPVMYPIDPENVRTRWLYYPTAGARKPKPSDHALPYVAAREAFKRIVLPVIASMEPYRGTKVDPNGVPGNPGHCDAYGGCGYMKAGLCSMTRGQVATNYFTGDDDMPTVPDNSIWKKLPLNGGPATSMPPGSVTHNVANDGPSGNSASTPASRAPVPAAAAPFKFEFPAPAAAVAAAPAPYELSAAAAEAGAEPAFQAPEKPKKTRAPKAEAAAPENDPLPGVGAPYTPVDPFEALRLIGRAMIAAGKVLAGQD